MGDLEHGECGMKRQLQLLRALYVEESGQDLIEYALIVGLIALVALAALGTLGQDLYNEFYVKIQNALNNI